MPEVLARLADRLPAVLIDTLREQYNGLAGLDAQIAQIERRLGQWMREEPAVQAIAQIPGVGLLTATAAVAAMGDAQRSEERSVGKGCVSTCRSRGARYHS